MSNFGGEAEDPGVGKILEKALIEPLQIRHSLGDCILSWSFHQQRFWGPVVTFRSKITQIFKYQ